MALNFDTSACNPPSPGTRQENQELASTLESIILSVRLSELTEENLDEWLFRVSFWDEIHHSHERILRSRNGLKERLTRWIGLKTNGYDDSRETWVTRQIMEMENPQGSRGTLPNKSSRVVHARARNAYSKAKDKGQPDSTLEPTILKSPEWSFNYARFVLKRPWKEAEAIIATSPEFSVRYAQHVVSGRFQAGEPAIAKSGLWSLYYATDVLHGAFTPGEKKVASKPALACWYAQMVKKGPWPLGEKAIRKEPYWIIEYASRVTRSHWPKRKKAILANPYWIVEYARKVVRGRWEEAEDHLLSSTKYCLEYARKVMKGPLPDALHAQMMLAASDGFQKDYVDEFFTPAVTPQIHGGP